jgi:hypothetical protein
MNETNSIIVKEEHKTIKQFWQIAQYKTILEMPTNFYQKEDLHYFDLIKEV